MKQTLIVIFCILLSSMAVAQTSLNAAGGTEVGSSASLSYTIGQIFSTYSEAASVSLQQGIQQSFEVQVSTAVGNDFSVLRIDFFPNPASEFLFVKLSGTPIGSLTYRLLDMTGKTLITGFFVGAEAKIELGQLPEAHYIVAVVSGKQFIKTFKLIKDQL